MPYNCSSSADWREDYRPLQIIRGLIQLMMPLTKTAAACKDREAHRTLMCVTPSQRLLVTTYRLRRGVRWVKRFSAIGPSIRSLQLDPQRPLTLFRGQYS